MFTPKQVEQLVQLADTPSFKDAHITITARVDTGKGYAHDDISMVAPLEARRILSATVVITYDGSKTWKVPAYSGVDAMNLVLSLLLACQNTREFHRQAATR